MIVVVLNIIFEYLPGDEISTYVGFSLLFICFLALILLRSCISQAERKLTPSVVDEDTQELGNPENFDVLFNHRGIKPGPPDPFDQYHMLPRMSYLDFDNNNTELGKIERH